MVQNRFIIGPRVDLVQNMIEESSFQIDVLGIPYQKLKIVIELNKLCIFQIKLEFIIYHSFFPRFAII